MKTRDAQHVGLQNREMTNTIYELYAAARQCHDSTAPQDRPQNFRKLEAVVSQTTSRHVAIEGNIHLNNAQQLQIAKVTFFDVLFQSLESFLSSFQSGTVNGHIFWTSHGW